MRGSRGDTGWPKVFAEGQRVIPGSHNKTFVDFTQGIWAGIDAQNTSDEDCGEDDVDDDDDGDDDDDEGDDGDDGLDTGKDSKTERPPELDSSLARVFMRGRLYKNATDAPDKYLRQAEVVERFCGHSTFQNPRDASAGGEEKPLVWLDERSEDGRRRKNRGLMNSWQLYQALKLDVSHFLK